MNMDAAIPEVPRSRFDLLEVLTFIFNNYELGSYLVAKDELPPRVSKEFIETRSINGSSLIIPEHGTAAIVLKKVIASEYGDEDDTDDTEYDPAHGTRNQPQSLGPSSMVGISEWMLTQMEDMFFIPYTCTSEYALLSVTDNRIPLAFVAKPSKPVRGLRRAVLLKLTGMGLPHVHMLARYVWLQNGKSSMTLMLYSTESEFLSEKYSILFNEYPNSRFPRSSDILETMVAFEQFICPFCTARGAQSCECPKQIVDRMKAPIPPKDKRDPLSLHYHTCLHLENGIQKFIVQLKNMICGATHSTIAYHRGITTTTGEKLHSRGLRGYIQELWPYFERQMMLKVNSSLNTPDSTGAGQRERPQQRLLQLPDVEDSIEKGRTKSSNENDLVLVQRQAQCSSSKRPFSIVSEDSVVIGLAAPWNDMNLAALSSAAPEEVPAASSQEGSGNCVKRRAVVPGASGEKLYSTANPHSASAVPSSSARNEREGSVDKYVKDLSSLDWPVDGLACNICGEHILRKYDLKRHILSRHGSMKPVKCPKCGMEFTRSTHLNTHVKARHEHAKFGCTICGREFSYIGACKRHMKSQHPSHDKNE